MRKRIASLFLTTTILGLACLFVLGQKANYKPKKGYVPDEQTAIAIAVAVWSPIYGRDKIDQEKPFKATLKSGVWTVTGTLPEGYKGARRSPRSQRTMAVF